MERPEATNTGVWIDAEDDDLDGLASEMAIVLDQVLNIRGDRLHLDEIRSIEAVIEALNAMATVFADPLAEDDPDEP